jgi:flagellar motor switch protein FliG
MATNSEKKKNFDGVQAVVDMLNQMNPIERERLMNDLSKKNPQVADSIRKRIFTFQDLVGWVDRDLQVLLREISQPKLVLALRGTDPEFKKKFLKNVSARLAVSLQEEMDMQGPQRKSDVLAAQSEVIEIAKKLISQGKIQQ